MPQTETVLFAGTHVEILIGGDQTAEHFSLLRITNPPGVSTPPHRHMNEDETVYVLSGRVQVETDGATCDLAAGEAIHLPRGEAHRLWNAGPDEAQALVFCTPSGFEHFVREAGEAVAASTQARAPDAAAMDRLVSLAPRFGIELL
ncbi:MAG: cupin domain-containing protein [Janthinobacterium lividum]